MLNSDTSSYDPSCNFGLAPYKDLCRQWALTDEALVNQFLGLLSNAQAPAADASNDLLLRQGLQMVAADDAAAANAVGAASEAAATIALGKLQVDSCMSARVVSKLDPTIPVPGFC